jgi:hypothetical protein
MRASTAFTGDLQSLGFTRTQPRHINGRSRGIRTPDTLLPKQVRYQTALYSVVVYVRDGLQ